MDYPISTRLVAVRKWHWVITMGAAASEGVFFTECLSFVATIPKCWTCGRQQSLYPFTIPKYFLFRFSLPAFL